MAEKKKSRKSREHWIKAALLALGQGGVDAVRVEALARRLGVTKGSFYWHFRDRQELLTEVLNTWEQEGTQAIIDAVEQNECATPEEKLKHLWKLAHHDFAGKAKEAIGATPELAIRDWARRDKKVADHVARVDEARVAYLRRLYQEAGHKGIALEARCLLVYSLLIGDYFIQVGHGKTSRKQVLEECLKMLSQNKL